MGALKLEYMPHYTYEDYCLWEGDWELISGIPYAMAPAPAPIIRHQEINLNIGVELKLKLKNCKQCTVLPEVDWKIDDDTVVQPDNLVVCDLKHKGKYLSQVPSIIFEVLSPSTRSKDENLKFDLYQENGVKYYVLVDLQTSSAKTYELVDGHYVLQETFRDKIFSFDLVDCKFDFSFERVWDI
jgi:Uma2 family endonuclease